jgi:hypothetical protein
MRFSVHTEGLEIMRRAWRDEAQTAIDALKKSKYGEREVDLRIMAAGMGFENGDPSSLRRAIGAHQFLERLRLEHPLSYAQLEGVTLSIAELIARWYSANPEQALKAAEDWHHGRATVQTIRDAMKISLPRGHGDKVGIAKQRAFKDSALQQIKEAVMQLGTGKIESIADQAWDKETGVKIDFLFEFAGERSETVAVLVVGPYKNTAMYRDRRDEWILRAFGTAWLFDRIVIAIPDQNFSAKYAARVRQLSQSIKEKTVPGDRLPKVDVVHVDVDPLDPEDSAALSNLPT